MNISRVVACISVAAAALCDTRIEGTPVPEQGVFVSRTDVVPVDVSVLDKDRRPIVGLTPADFTLQVDGRDRSIAAFAEVELPPPASAPATASWVREAPYDVVTNALSDEGRLVAILMDATIPNGAPTIAARAIAHAAVDELGPNDLAAVVRSSVFSNNGKSQGFTHDRARLLAAIDSPFMGTTDPPTMSAGGMTSPPPGAVPAFQTQPHCEVIFNIARAMLDAPRRRKILLFIGSRVETGGSWRIGGEDRSCRNDMFSEIKAANLTVHVVDPMGLLTNAVAADYGGPVSPNLVRRWTQVNEQRLESLRMLPAMTGGRVVLNTNAPTDRLADIFAESQSYYLVGFEADSATSANRLHSIRVRVSRTGATVRARESYGTTDAAAIIHSAAAKNGTDDALRRLSERLDGSVPRRGLPLSITAAPFGVRGTSTAAVAVAIGATLPSAVGPRRLTVTVGAFDTKGRAVAVKSQLIEVSVALARQDRITDGITERLDVPPGSYELRAAVRDETSGAEGTVFSFVDVPDFSKAALHGSGAILYRALGQPASDQRLAAIVPMLPTVERTLRPLDAVRAFMRLYGVDESQPVAVNGRITDAGERTVETWAIPTASRPPDGVVAVDTALPLARLGSGPYLLTIAVAQGDLHLERQIRFQVGDSR